MEIREAVTPWERREIRRLRYRVNVEEQLRESRFVDHATREIADPLDRNGVHIAAWTDDTILGAVRLSLLADTDLDFMSEGLPSAHLASMDLDRCSLTSRLMVLSTHRGSSLALRLARATFRSALQRGIHHDYIVCATHLEPFFTRLGYRSLGFRSIHPEAGRVSAHLLDLRDLKGLQRIRSPFAADLLAHQRLTDHHFDTQNGAQSS